MANLLNDEQIEQLKQKLNQGEEVPTLQLKWALAQLRDTAGAMSFRAHYAAIRAGFNTHGIKVDAAQ